ncbi:hypothetical protein [Chamaesiphon sp. VAR_69_metabat_338]|uniref:hypothetical protein n=1 Tax=Chamaesiphon sp. VAR_69_metabat_338 TaxID=2964704 RepID=UPI00286E6F41|nr:hypothetical protein [Chamaesiphon sp. VAR_69_metabat_338]
MGIELVRQSIEQWFSQLWAESIVETVRSVGGLIKGKYRLLKNNVDGAKLVISKQGMVDLVLLLTAVHYQHENFNRIVPAN